MAASPAPPAEPVSWPTDARYDTRPVLFVTTEIPPDRVGAFRALADLIPVEFALFGGGLHATAGVTDHGLPVLQVSQRDVHALAASGRYSAVVAGTAGRIALPAAWLGAERARIPFVLWTALWAHPRSVAHLPGALLLRLLYRRAAVVMTYGPHVSRFAERLGARQTVVAPQAVDQRFWAAPAGAAGPAAADADHPSGDASASSPPADGPLPRFLFAGRDGPGKGVDWLLRAWDASGLGAEGSAELVLAGPDPGRASGHAGVRALGHVAPEALREEMRAATAVVVPSQRTATFREPWGLVVNEAMHTGTLVIASTEVGAVAGGLVVDGLTGVVVPSGNMNRLAAALRSALPRTAPEIRGISAAGHQAASSYTQTAWAAAFAESVKRSVASRP